LSKKKFCVPVRNAYGLLSSSYPAGSVVTENPTALFKLCMIPVFHMTKPLPQDRYNTPGIKMVNFE